MNTCENWHGSKLKSIAQKKQKTVKNVDNKALENRTE